MREFAGFTGGHLKFADYLAHTAASGVADPVLWQAPDGCGRAGNPFDAFPGRTITRLARFPAYFLAGTDWLVLDRAGIDPGRAPVSNLVQGLRHAEPGTPLFACLSRPAVRICVSAPVATAVAPHTKGEVLVIPNGIAREALPPPAPLARGRDAPPGVLIAGLKDPKLARAVADRLDGRVAVDLLTGLLPRPDFLARLAAASIAVLLPLPKEGFYLPGLEAMALGRGVVMPDCIGSRAYGRKGENCLMPGRDPAALAAAALALAADPGRLARLAAAARHTASRHTLEAERAAYHALLARLLPPP